MPDRIEAGTYLLAGAITGGDITAEGCVPDHIMALLDKLDEAGLVIETSASSARVMSNGRIKSSDVATNPYPGFATDFQAQYMALMALGDSSCEIIENVFENRFMHVQELVRMGASIRVSGKKARIQGVKKLSGAHVQRRIYGRARRWCLRVWPPRELPRYTACTISIADTTR